MPVTRSSLAQTPGAGASEITNTVYNTDGTLASATIDGVDYSFTYLFGKISTVVGGGITKTYNWVNGRLASMVVS